MYESALNTRSMYFDLPFTKLLHILLVQFYGCLLNPTQNEKSMIHYSEK